MSTPVTRHLLSPMWDGLTPEEQAGVLEVLSVFHGQLHDWWQQYHQDHAEMLQTAREVINEILRENAPPTSPAWHEQLGYQTPHYLVFTNPQQWHYWHPQIELSAAALGDDSERKGLVIPGRWSEMASNYNELATELFTLAHTIKRNKFKQRNELTRAIYSSRVSDSGKLLLGKVIMDMYPVIKANRKLLSEVPYYEGLRAQNVGEQAASIAEINHLTYKQLTDLEQSIQQQIKEMVVNLERQFHALTAKVQFAEQLTEVVAQEALAPISVSPRAQYEAVAPDPVAVIVEEQPEPIATSSPPSPQANVAPDQTQPEQPSSNLSPQVEELRLRLIGSNTINKWYGK